MKAREVKKKETKKPVLVTIKPSTKDKASKKAKKENKSLSQVIEDLLYDYAE